MQKTAGPNKILKEIKKRACVINIDPYNINKNKIKYYLKKAISFKIKKSKILNLTSYSDNKNINKTMYIWYNIILLLLSGCEGVAGSAARPLAGVGPPQPATATVSAYDGTQQGTTRNPWISYVFALTANKLFASERGLDVSDAFLDAFNQKNLSRGSFYVGLLFFQIQVIFEKFCSKVGWILMISIVLMLITTRDKEKHWKNSMKFHIGK